MIFKLALYPWRKSFFQQCLGLLVFSASMVITGVSLWTAIQSAGEIKKLEENQGYTLFLDSDLSNSESEELLQKIQYQFPGAIARVFSEEDVMQVLEQDHPKLKQELQSMSSKDLEMILPRTIEIEKNQQGEKTEEILRSYSGVVEVKSHLEQFRNQIHSLEYMSSVSQILFFVLLSMIGFSLIQFFKMNLVQSRSLDLLLKHLGAKRSVWVMVFGIQGLLFGVAAAAFSSAWLSWFSPQVRYFFERFMGEQSVSTLPWSLWLSVMGCSFVMGCLLSVYSLVSRRS